MKTILIKIGVLLVIVGLLAGLVISFFQAQQRIDSQLEVYFLDFSNEDAILVRYNDHAVLIDTAEEKHKQELSSRLYRLGVERLDALILTHPDKDHIGGAAAVLEQFTVDTVLRSPFQKDSEQEKALIAALALSNAQDTIPDRPVHLDWGDVTLDIYPPGASKEISSNESSLITVLQHGEIRMVLAGDAQENRLAEMLNLPVAPCTLYKLPHHGRDSSLSVLAIETLQPPYVVVTAKETGPLVGQALVQTDAQVFFTAGRVVRASSNGQALSMTYLNWDKPVGKG